MAGIGSGVTEHELNRKNKMSFNKVKVKDVIK